MICGKCTKSNIDEAGLEIPGLTCMKCKGYFHLTCITGRTTREKQLCDTCATSESDKSLGPPFLSSTIVGLPSTKEVYLEREVIELRKQLALLKPTNKAPDTENVEEQSTGGSIDNGTLSLNRSQTALYNSIRTRPLSKAELEARKSVKPLPSFDGNPTKWFLFYVSYKDSSIRCGFSAAEDMDRIKDALLTPALETVQHFFGLPHKLDKVLNTLEQCYGRPGVLVAYVEDQITKIPALKDDLSNISEFYKEVLSVVNALELLDEPHEYESFVEKLVGKLGVHQAMDWMKTTKQEGRTIVKFAEYIEELCDRMISLRRYSLAFDARTSNAKAPKPAASGPSKNRILLQDEIQKPPPSAPLNNNCLLGCSSWHSLSNCQKFFNMSIGDRWKVVKDRRRCVSCFGKHYSSKCRAAKKCAQPGCDRMHHPLLHRDDNVHHQMAGQPSSQTPGPSHVANSGGRKSRNNAPILIGVSREEAKTTLYGVAPVIITANGKQIKTLALMDNGSSMTLIRTDLARQLGLEGEKKDVSVAWADGIGCGMTTEKVEFDLSNENGERVFRIAAQTKDDLVLPAHLLAKEMIRDEGLQDLPLPYFDGAVPQVLIGLDNAHLMTPSETRRGSSENLFACNTALGWVVFGQLRPTTERCMLINGDAELEEIVEQFIEGEHFGLADDDTVNVLSDDNARAMELMDGLTRRVGDRYESGLLWRRPDVKLPPNRELAEQRHSSFQKKLRRDPELWRRLTNLMELYRDKGYIQEVGPVQVSHERLWYLPIFSVTNANKPEKVRIVWDGAAEWRGTSLNSCLLTGPDLNASLVHILLRFRLGKVGISGDIQEMFHQVLVRQADRSAQRFLWKGIDDDRTREFEMRVMTFGSACSPTVAQYVKNMNADRFATSHPDAVYAIKNNHYVDDFVDSRDTPDEVIALARAVRDIHQGGGFFIHKWISNDATVVAALEGGPTHGAVSEVSPCNSATVLGLNWNTSTDCLSFRWRADLDDLLKRDQMPTKRLVLRLGMSIFDPLGLISHITVLPRIILRDVWRTNTAWDDQIGEECRQRWDDWKSCIERLDRIQVPRYYGALEDQVDIHIFVDGSESAIGAAAYVVCRRDDGQTTTTLCLAKCKVAPLKTKGIPRLELDAAVLGTRVAAIIRSANVWNIGRTIYWSDSQVVLYWLRNHKRRYTSYVANRVGDILRRTDAKDWRWVPTNLNPADWATKFQANREDDPLWWHGPRFLHETETRWPNSFEEPTTIAETLRVLLIKDERPPNHLIPPYQHFSKWESLVRNTACAHIFIDIVQRRREKGSVTQGELDEATKTILRDIQGDCSTQQQLAAFSPFKDEHGIWRMRGRTATASHLSYDARYPVILPAGHCVTALIADSYHRTGAHCHTDRAINEMRKKFVVPHIRREMNRVITRCQECKLRRTRPLRPEMAALPACRVAVHMRPFSYTGIDNFGPITVAIGRRREKRWGVLFTCLTTRAVYLEVVQSLSAASCMMALDSLAARHGAPVEYRSDNGTNFVSSSKLYMDPDGQRPRWKFNVPHAPHTAGAWERMIGLTKKILDNLRLDKTPTEERLRWLLCRAEYLINSRPLTDVSSTAAADVAITPNDILFGQSSDRDFMGGPQDVGFNYLTTREADVQRFWERWTAEYLPKIAARPKWTSSPANPVKEGDIVYICDDDYRYGWRKGRVTEAQQDMTGQLRRVTVKTADGSHYRRSTHHIAPIALKDLSKGECKKV